MKKILVTGGSGYIGENIYKRDNGFHEIILCDKGYTKHKIIDSYYKTREAHELSFRDIEQYDGIIHLSALSGIEACEKDPSSAWIDNVVTSMNIFELSRRAGIPVVFTSSQAAKNPQSNKYAQIKYTIECMANVQNSYGAEIYILRLANVYGGIGYLDKKNTCVKQFITKYRNEEPIVVHGDGNQKRDFVHVYDVCNAIMMVLEKRPKVFAPIDIGTGVGISVLELAKMFGDRYPIVHEKTRDVGTSSSVADTKLAEEVLGFKAKRDLRRYVEFVKKHKDVE